MVIQTDVLGRQIIFNSYIPLTLAYPVEDSSRLETIASTLKNGLLQLSKSFPWAGGQVIYEYAGEDGAKVPVIVPLDLEKHSPLVVKDLREDDSLPSFASLKESEFPFSAPVLHEWIISPRYASPHTNPTESSIQPTLLVQATWIKGGLLLTILGHHAVMDAMGFDQTMSLLSKACSGIPFTQEELTSGNMPRNNSILPLDTPDMVVAEQHFIPSSASAEAAPVSDTRPKCRWVYFDFAASALVALKDEASKTLPLLSSIPLTDQQPSPQSQSPLFVSTDDALSAFIWQSILRARQQRLTPTNRTKLARAVDIRRPLGLPETYPGVALINAYPTSTVQCLVDQPLGEIAWQLRSQLLDEGELSLVASARTLATLLQRPPAPFTAQDVFMVVNMDIAHRDVAMSSWVKLGCYRLEFNMGLGKPVAARRPYWSEDIEGLMFLMPKTLEGSIALGICLREEDLERLKEDPLWTRYARFIG
ncbi:hypothetical protein BGZ73_003668 [Actinomortierella ambigua]|nr:hypothetical protein BGZ73_003668 [Actinomortierella ambigua]